MHSTRSDAKSGVLMILRFKNAAICILFCLSYEYSHLGSQRLDAVYGGGSDVESVKEAV